MTQPETTTELVMTRVFAAPRALVFAAFTDPDQLARWFGPVGFSVPRDTVDVDARTGGHQRFTMVSDADPDFTSPVDARFTEVVEDALIVGVEEGSEGSPRTTTRVEFHEEGGTTRLVLRQGPYSAEVVSMAQLGWESSFTKLDTLLAA
ncbi:SRPBCC family protein [Umezawaea beigongshangensis]|uniref:SRPBCC family protein n=1 Tax=Umezawaea beigongshangensis TaxID=2780383 RepID=UPI0018F1AE54|nr:SRPBCC domain-containing protein [Umezawaea beigongshangensis]